MEPEEGMGRVGLAFSQIQVGNDLHITLFILVKSINMQIIHAELAYLIHVIFKVTLSVSQPSGRGSGGTVNGKCSCLTTFHCHGRLVSHKGLALLVQEQNNGF